MDQLEFKQRTDRIFDQIARNFAGWNGLNLVPVFVFKTDGSKDKYLVEHEAAKYGYTPGKMLEVMRQNIGSDLEAYGVVYVVIAGMGIVVAHNKQEAEGVVDKLVKGELTPDDMKATYKSVLVMYCETRDGLIDGRMFAIVKEDDSTRLEAIPQVAEAPIETLFKNFPLKTFNTKESKPRKRRRRKTNNDEGRDS